MLDLALRPDSLNIISLCTGGGGLDRAVELAIPRARHVVCVERESFALANLVTQMRQGVMAPAPIFSDVRAFRGRGWRGLVDGVIGGIPCQPHSLAGKRLGREDERDLWGPARRIFVQSGAWFILIENVGGMLSSGGAERVYRDLHRLGCKVEGGIFRASEVGFPHERERLFILGVADPENRPGWTEQQADGARRGRRGLAGDGTDIGLADASCARLQRRGSDGHRSGQCEAAERSCGALEDAARGGCGREGDFTVPSDGPASTKRALVDAESIGRREGQSKPELRRRRGSAGGADRDMAHADGIGSPAHGRDAGEVGGVQKAQRQPEHGPALSRRGSAAMDDAASDDGRLHPGWRTEGGRAPDAGGAGQVVDSFGRGRDGRPCEPVWSAEERAAVEWASEGPLYAPGPSELDAWRWIAEHAPERLPAISRHDLFRIEIGAARAAAYGDPAARPAQAWGNSSPASWLDESGPYGLRAAVVSQIAQSTLRRGPDGVATRIDELRLLGNGVVDLAGAYAFRTLTIDLARRSVGATRLVGVMDQQ